MNSTGSRRWLCLRLLWPWPLTFWPQNVISTSTNRNISVTKIWSNSLNWFLARDAFVRTNRRAIAMMFVRLSVCLSVCLSGTGVHCDHTVHFSAVSVYGWIVQCSGYLDTKACPPTPSRLFPVPPAREVGVWIWRHGCTNYAWYLQNGWTYEVKLLLSAKRKSYMPCRLAQQRMTLSDLEWPFRLLT